MKNEKIKFITFQHQLFKSPLQILYICEINQLLYEGEYFSTTGSHDVLNAACERNKECVNKVTRSKYS